MISEGVLKYIAQVFCGDINGFYAYKSGPNLVSFFNNWFDFRDVYGQGFPSRWAYVYDKLVNLVNSGRIDTFFNIVLGKTYLMSDLGITEVEAAEKSEEILSEFNRSLGTDQYIIVHNGNEYHLIEKSEDLVLIGSGGFANVYRQKTTGLIIKKLKDDFIADEGIRSRFKREFTITKSLQDLHGIITVFSYDEGSCFYTMEPAEQTLEDYVRNNRLTDEIKLNCIRQVLFIMTEVHKRDVIHRDLSPNNIFIISGMLKIADFGLGKDLNVFTSHQTLYTNAVGQYYYCAPEQFMMLRDADKRSDVYSLGRIINFVMNGDPRNSNHIFRSVAEKATNSDAAYRYADAGQLAIFLEKSVAYHAQENRTEQIERKIQSRTYDEDVESYIYDMNGEQLCKFLLSGKAGASDVLVAFMRTSEDHAQHIIQGIESSFRDVCKTFESNDPFASFSARVIRGNFSFVVKETAATILRYVAWDVNRFYAQHIVEDLIGEGIEPMLEDVIKQ